MAERFPEATATAFTQVSFAELERALEELRQQVAEQKRQLALTFQRLHQMVEEREVALMAELDAIPAGVAVRLEERRASLEQLSQHKEETERKVQANRLSEFLQQQLSGIRTEMDKILSEQIPIPHFSLSCQIQDMRNTLKKYRVMKAHNPYTFRTLPIWHGVRKGEGIGELYIPTALCIDPISQLVFVAEYNTRRIQLFTREGKHHSTLRNADLLQPRAMMIHKEHIFASTWDDKSYLLKMNSKGETIKRANTHTKLRGLYIDSGRLYTCTDKTITLQLYDLNLKPTNRIVLKIVSVDGDHFITSSLHNVIVNKQQLFGLFRHQTRSDQIQIFHLDGTYIRSLATGDNIKNAKYFCLDSHENVLVSDYSGHCIRVFSPDGVLMQSLGREGKAGPGELWEPHGIAEDSLGRIVIVDSKNMNKLQAF